MQKPTYVRQSNGTIAIDNRLLLLKYRLLLLLTLILGGAIALGLHLIFAR
jgi:hypothetical protein